MVDTTLNPFSGIITSGMKTMFSNALSSLLLNTACTTPCRIIYGSTKFTDCVNCIYDAIGQKSSNRYQDGGPIPFQLGTLCPVCWTAGTPIKTIGGYKNIEDIQIGDLVFNGVGYYPVVNKLESNYSGPLYNFKSYGSSLPYWVTENHKFPIVQDVQILKYGRRRLDRKKKIQIIEVPAKEIGIDDAVIMPYYEVDLIDLEKVDIPEFGEVIIDDELLYMFGWWLAEGSISHKKQYTRSGNFALAGHKEEYVADNLTNIINKKFDVGCKQYYRKEKETSLYCEWNSVDLVKLFAIFGRGSENKVIPSFLWSQLSTIQKYKIFEAYFAGDGHSRQYEKNITSTSKQLSFQMYDLLFSLGKLPAISYNAPYTDKWADHQAVYNVNWISRSQLKKGIKKIDEGYLSAIKNINIKNDSCKVYNFEVGHDEHKYIAGNVLTHNCNGLGKIADEPTEENVFLMVIWDYKQWINFNLNTRSPDGLVQTLSEASLTPKLLRADRVIFATDIEGYVRHQFTRDGEAEPCGFGNNDFVSIMWRRIG